MRQLQAAISAYQVKDLDAAESVLNEILAVSQRNPNALHLLGCIYKDRGMLQQAVELIQSSIQEDANDPIAFLNLGKIFLMVGQYENAVTVFKESLNLSQNIPEAWFCFGNALKGIHEIEGARQAYQNTLHLDPNHIGAITNLAALLSDNGELEAAEQLFLKAMDSLPSDPSLLINYGRFLSKRKDFSAAIVQYRRALDLAPSSPELHYNYANALCGQGEAKAAILSYRKAIDLRPDFVEAILNLAILSSAEGDLDAAIVGYQKVISLKPGLAEAHFDLANVFREQGEVDQAIASYQKAIDLKSDFEDAYYCLAFFLIRGVRILEALSVLRKGVQNCKNEPRIKHLLGSLLLSQGETREGQSFLQEAFSVDHAFAKKVDGFSLRSDTPEEFWHSLHSSEKMYFHYWEQTPLRAKLASFICSLDGVRSVLECGCNVGSNLYAINSLKSQIELNGIDMNEKPIAFGKKKFNDLGVNADMRVLRLQDLCEVASKSVDVSFTCAVLQHIPPEFIPGIIENMIRVSRKYVVFWELHGFSQADAFVHQFSINSSPNLDGRWVHDYWNILEQIGVDRNSILAQQVDPRICLGKVSDFNCIFSFPIV